MGFLFRHNVFHMSLEGQHNSKCNLIDRVFYKNRWWQIAALLSFHFQSSKVFSFSSEKMHHLSCSIPDAPPPHLLEDLWTFSESHTVLLRQCSPTWYFLDLWECYHWSWCWDWRKLSSKHLEGSRLARSFLMGAYRRWCKLEFPLLWLSVSLTWEEVGMNYGIHNYVLFLSAFIYLDT